MRVLGVVLALLVSGAAAPVREITFVGVPGSPSSPPGENVFAIRADGAGLRMVAAGATDPRWSPDGSRLVYTGLHTDANGSVTMVGLFVLAANGGQPSQITSGSDNVFGWSRDGRWIGFLRNENGRQDLFVVRPDGSRAHEVVPGSGPAAWAPDSKHLLIAPHQGLELVDLAGHTRPIRHTACNGGGSISPNGRWLAFVRCLGRPSSTGLAVEHPDGSGLHWLTRPVNPGGSFDPAWSPDGTKIAYAAERFDGYLDHSEIRIVTLSGRNLGNLDSYAQDHDGSPQWSPDGREIVFDRDAAVEPNGEDDRLLVGDVKTGHVRQLYPYIARGTQSWQPR